MKHHSSSLDLSALAEGQVLYNKERSAQTERVALLSLCGNLFLALIKIISGLLFGSSAMMADGINSAGDCASSLTMLLGNRIASKPRDAGHPYGHDKAEYIFSGIMGILLLFMAWKTFTSALASLLRPQPLRHAPVLLLVCAVTIVSKCALFFYARRTGKRYKNPMTDAIAQDHRSDVFVTVGTALGIIGSRSGFPLLDGVVGLLISAVIALSGARVLREAFSILMDTTAKASSPLIAKAQQIIQAIPEVDHIDAITASPVGSSFLLVIKISVPGQMSVTQAHRLTRRIKDPLMQHVDVAEVIVHVNPMEEHQGPSQLPT